MKIKEKVGLIGVGNMGTAILEGLLKKKRIMGSQVMVYDKITEKAAAFTKQWKAVRVSSNQELVKKSDIVILAVKPQDLPQTAQEMAGVWKKKQVLISILAGMPLAQLRKAAGPIPKIIRAMPNLGAKAGEAVTAITGEKGGAVRETPLQVAEKIFSACGKVLRLEEKHFDLVTALSGSGPAYFFLLMEMLAEEGVKRGLSPEQARLLAVQTALGAALLACGRGDSRIAPTVNPAELRVMVTSKGGTTEAALKVLKKRQIRKIFSEAIAAAHRRGAELSKGA